MPTKYKPSIVQQKCECFICHKSYTVGLDHHHCISGRGLKKLADEDALWIWLCRECHSLIHDKGEAHGVTEDRLKAIGESAYLNARMKEGYPKEAAEELFLRRYGRHYIL